MQKPTCAREAGQEGAKEDLLVPIGVDVSCTN